MSKITIESTIDRRYLRNRTKDEIIEHVMRAFDEIDKLTADRADLYAALDACVDTLRAIHMTYGFGSCKSQAAADQEALEVEIDKAWGPAIAALRRVTDQCRASEPVRVVAKIGAM